MQDKIQHHQELVRKVDAMRLDMLARWKVIEASAFRAKGFELGEMQHLLRLSNPRLSSEESADISDMSRTLSSSSLSSMSVMTAAKAAS
jgi:hypothetical protein